jgi:two-component system response regulator DevR
MKAAAKAIRVVLVDDSTVVRMGLKVLLEGTGDIGVVGEAGSVAESALVCARTRPEVVLLDIRLPDGSGFDACRAILAHDPDTRILVLTSVADDSLLDKAIHAGAHGYLLKEIDAQGLVQAIRDVASGKSILDPEVTARVLSLVKSGGSHAALSTLSPQERRVVALIASGRTNKEVGSELGLSEKTVKNYLSNIFEKLNISRRAQAAALYAKENPS